jgi:hypothetical protein
MLPSLRVGKIRVGIVLLLAWRRRGEKKEWFLLLLILSTLEGREK